MRPGIEALTLRKPRLPSAPGSSSPPPPVAASVVYKCNVASIGFVAMCAARGFAASATSDAVDSAFTPTTVGCLILSSALGILVGDVLWLEALRLLGPKHVLAIDSLKPFAAAALGWAGLGEVLRGPAWGGMALTVLGVGVVGWEEQRRTVPREEKEGGGDDEEDGDVGETEATDRVGFDNEGGDVSRFDDEGGDASSERASSREAPTNCHREAERRRFRRGYFCAVFNVLADSVGSLLTKKFGAGMTTWSINLIRFGFAGIVTLCISVGMRLRRRRSRKEEGRIDPKSRTESGGTECRDASSRADATDDAASGTKSPPPPPPRWYELPTLSRAGWTQITLGVGLVTFLTPALSNFALFRVALGLAVSLGSVGPLYGLLLDWPFRGRRPTAWGCAGVLLAIAGVVVLCAWGT